jgi:DNA polymerase (family 10)
VKLDRHEIVARLREIASLLDLHGGNKFKARAFARGARALEASRQPIERMIEENRLEELPGIGVALRLQIEELHRTGSSELLESLRKGLPAGVLELSQVGVGLHAIQRLHEELGISTVAELKRAATEGRLRDVKGYGEKREKRILDAIAKHEAGGPRILLSEGLRLARSLEDEIASLPGVESVHLAGSLARSAELSDDVRLVAESEAPARAIARVAKMPRVATIERDDESSCRLRLADGTRVEVVACAERSLATTLVHESSTAAHWEALALRAESRGFVLGADGLARDGERVALADERDLYDALALPFVPPEQREEAPTGESFDDLVALGDVRGFVHCHTDWSDGKGTIEEMARAAKERGAAFITITDHSRAAFYAGGLDVERLEAQWDAIDEAAERVGIRIFKGTEADILADGAIDWPDRILERLDVVIASIHARHRQDEAAMTERVLRAMRHPVFKIWGHPMGRLVTSRPPIPLRVEEVLDAIAESRGAIEINGDPHRLDLEPRWAREARKRGIPFVVSVDAHAMRELDNVKYAVGLARRAGIRRGEVLNAQGPSAFARAVKPAA